MDDMGEQENELIALSSIFDNETFNIISSDDLNVIICKTVKFVIDIELPETIEVYYTYHDGKENIESTKRARISYLPPVYATVSLPNDYPNVSTPNVVLSAAWLHPILSEQILRKLNHLSTENPGLSILYLYYQLIKDETFVLIGSTINLNLCLQTSPSLLLRSCHAKLKRKSFSKSNSVDESQNTKISFNHVRQLFDSLIDYNDYRLEQLFRNEKHLCEICYTEFYGSECLQFTPCKHVFCKLCCKQFFEMHIKEGSFELLKCLAEKCNTVAIPMFIKSVVDDSAFERYDKLTLSRSLDLMRDVVVCPRANCGSFVVMDENIRNMALCSECNFAFCTLCRKVYHGLARCTFTNTEIQCILNEYKTGDEKVRRVIEEKYGKVTIERLVEESESSQWVTDNCRPCPICSSPIQKLDGCNKMSCMKCGSYFCWLCMKTLNKDTPYKHFNDPDSQCFNLLFRGVRTMDDEGSDDEDDF